MNCRQLSQSCVCLLQYAALTLVQLLLSTVHKVAEAARKAQVTRAVLQHVDTRCVAHLLNGRFQPGPRGSIHSGNKTFKIPTFQALVQVLKYDSESLRASQVPILVGLLLSSHLGTHFGATTLASLSRHNVRINA